MDEESSGAETLPPDSGSDSAPVPSETPVSSEDEQYIKLIDSMTLEEKLGQLLIVGYPSDRQAEKLIKEYKVGVLYYSAETLIPLNSCIKSRIN